MKKLHFILIGLMILLHKDFTFCQTALKLEEIATGYNKPLDIKHAGDKRLFIATQPGVIWIIDSLGNKVSTPFLDINDKVVNSGNERGLLGLSFHPNYNQNGYFYVNYIGNDGNSKISRFSVTTDPNIASSASEVLLLGITQPYQNHNGGCLQFGPDGYLYIASGDGGSGGDPQANSQNPQKFLGKILRLDVDGSLPYSIPNDNPFVNSSDTLHEIWTLGWRNPWRFSFDRMTGDMWIGDVGQDTWEEIDFEAAGSKGGRNYGWRCYEGNANFNTANCGPKDSYVFPVFAYDQNSGDCSVTGGYVYRGNKYPGLFGKYIYADYCSGKINVIYPNTSGKFVYKTVSNLTNLDYSSFGEDLEGELYISGLSSGKIFKVSLDCPPNNTQFEVIKPCSDTLSGSITLLGGMNLSYKWNTGDTTATINGIKSGNYSVTIINNDNYCAEIISSISVQPWDQPDLSINWSDSILSLNNNLIPNSIQWYQNGILIPGANFLNYKPIKSGSYSAVFKSPESGCIYESESLNIIITATDLILKDLVHYIWPNPVTKTLHMNWLCEVSDYQYKLYDCTGQIIQKGKQNDRADIEVDDLIPGFYFIEIATSKARQVLKFQKK